ncbi:MAG: hypothetical protein EAZ97_05245 [Bacteroidetes bacterium]|nr:MAG: hypothetical protein EAZ97_05245 [Bacteroidota bacterium]
MKNDLKLVFLCNDQTPKTNLMLIANPIYDVVFKYLMEDSKVAKLLISRIIDMKIIDLDFQPQEFIADFGDKSKKKKKKITKKVSIPEEVYLTIYRLDFKARISTPEGEKLVIIEIQKAKYISEIMRFRRYLGEQYSSENNAYEVENKQGLTVKKGLPIISIYFLGEDFEHISGVPVVKVNNQVIDLYSGKEIKKKEDFIESLTHKSFIISIPNLKESRRNELETILSVFDQSNRSSDHHILNISEEDFPEEYWIIIRRLRKASSEQAVRKQMTMEDDLQDQFENIVRALAKGKEVIAEKEKTIEEKEKALSESRQTIEEKEKALSESRQTIEEKEKALSESKQTIEEKEKALSESKQTIEEKEKTIENQDDLIRKLFCRRAFYFFWGDQT